MYLTVLLHQVCLYICMCIGNSTYQYKEQPGKAPAGKIKNVMSLPSCTQTLFLYSLFRVT